MSERKNILVFVKQKTIALFFMHLSPSGMMKAVSQYTFTLMAATMECLEV